MKDNLLELDSQHDHLKTTTDDNIEDGLDDLDPTNQDDVNPLDGATGFEFDDLIDVIGSDVSLSPESRFHFDNMETIIFQNVAYTLPNNFTAKEGHLNGLYGDMDDASEPMVLVTKDVSAPTPMV